MAQLVNRYVFISIRGAVVGTGKLFPISNNIHGYDLRDYCRPTEKLVAIYHVQIYQEFEGMRYPYRFGGQVQPPSNLWELNDPDRSFKSIIAWDERCLESNLQGDDLKDHPQVVHAPDLQHNTTGITQDCGSTISLTNNVSFKRKLVDIVEERPVSKARTAVDVNLFKESSPSVEYAKLLTSNFIPECPGENADDAIAPVPVQQRHINPLHAQPIFNRAHSVTYPAFKKRVPSLSGSPSPDSINTPREALLSPVQERRMETAHIFPITNSPSSKDTSSESSIEDYFDDPNWYMRSRRRPKRNPKWRGKSKPTKTTSAVSQALFTGPHAVSSEPQRAEVDTEVEPGNETSHAGEDTSLVDDVRGINDVVRGDRECVDDLVEGEAAAEGTLIGVFEGANGSEDVYVASSDTSDAMSMAMRSLLPKKSKYIFKQRKPARDKSVSTLRARRLASATRPDNFFSVKKDCCRRRCFHKVDVEYAMRQYRRIMRMVREEKKRTLKLWLDDQEQKFRFNGLIVCSIFLQKGFEFSTTLQSSVKGTRLARAPPTALALPREVRRDTVRNRIVLYLRHRANTTGDMMPTRQYINLPAMNKFEIWQQFCAHFVKNDALGKQVKPPSLAYFYKIWKADVSEVKTRKRHGFTVCTTCEEIRSEMDINHANEKVLGVLRDARVVHLQAMEEERLGYTERRDLAEMYPRKYCSIILDGADQSAYGLPHFEYKTKSDKGHKMKVKCIGALEHAKKKALTLYTMTEEFESGANHVLETAHRVLNKKKAECGKLPEILFVQADNCTRENKNRYFMSYFQMLVACGVFVEVQVSFLPIGHTHADIDQAFSSVSRRLNDNKAVTMGDLLNELRQCYQPKAKAGELLQVANLSGLFEKTKSVRNVHGFATYRYFRFTRSEAGIKDGYYQTSCDVKTRHCDQWTSFPVDRGYGFLKFVPDLSKTPPTITRVPNNVAEVNKCLEAAESRVKDSEKMEELRRLRNKVYTQRSDPFHWDLISTMEMNGDYMGCEDGATEESGSESDCSSDGGNRYDIGIAANRFVATKTFTDPKTRFWIAKVIEVTKMDFNDKPREIKLRWYNAKGNGDPYYAVYEPASTTIDGHRRAYLDTVKCSTVICRFNELSSQRRLRDDVKIQIRAALGEE